MRISDWSSDVCSSDLFIHTATLLHDDVVDESDLRRGRASANEVFGNKPSVLVGDFLFARAFQLMVENGSIDVLRILSQASAVIAEGEVLQLARSEEHTSELQSLMRISYAVFCLKKKKKNRKA